MNLYLFYINNKLQVYASVVTTEDRFITQYICTLEEMTNLVDTFQVVVDAGLQQLDANRMQLEEQKLTNKEMN
jgi:hypothetical protein